MKRKLLNMAFVSVFALASCKKAEMVTPIPPLISTSTIKVPTGFKWENSRNINFTVNIIDARFQDIIQVVSIYDGDPMVSGNLLAKGSVTNKSLFKSTIYLSKQITQVFIVKTSPDGSISTITIPVGTLDVITSIGA